MRKPKYNIINIQNDINDGMSWRQLKLKYKMANNTLANYVKKGLIKSNSNNKNQWIKGFKISKDTIEKIRKKSTGRKHSEETKQKISEKQIKYLMENPDKVPYLINHSSKKSWPEQVFENALKSSGIGGWVYGFQNGIYEYDFAFPKEKIDIEIDGGTHKTEKVKRIDERRDKFSRQNGWRVLRFEAERVKKDVISCINELKNYL